MTIKIGINGFRRISRLIMRVIMENKADIDVAVVNDLADTKTNDHLFKYDSSYGIYPGEVEAGARTKTVPITKIPDGWTIADIGPDTIREFATELKKCKTVVWNGSVGVFEIPEFANGTHSMIKVLADLEATTIIGRGSTAEAVIGMGLADKMSHVSTGGGASLEFLEGRVLLRVAVLQDK